MPPIRSTHWLVWFLEHAARNAVLRRLESGESTVGVAVCIEHTAVAPIGAEVVARARVILVDGSLITFQLEATMSTRSLPAARISCA